MKANSFDVLKEMGERDMNVMLAPLSNIIRANKVKAGTQITIGFAGDVIAGIMDGKYVGGLILADKEEFERVKREIESA